MNVKQYLSALSELGINRGCLDEGFNEAADHSHLTSIRPHKTVPKRASMEFRSVSRAKEKRRNRTSWEIKTNSH